MFGYGIDLLTDSAGQGTVLTLQQKVHKGVVELATPCREELLRVGNVKLTQHHRHEWVAGKLVETGFINLVYETMCGLF
ncbi:hypothetical protein ACIBMZ_26670 [Micromonospora sp. NPDC049900]|uniref:hypothetical protein n=1 Tax=Micromonospora sp. NPDC049900 TaxID=3364275 RepID=UPI0037B51E4A